MIHSRCSGHVVQAVTVRWEGLHRRCALGAVGQQVLPGELTLPRVRHHPSLRSHSFAPRERRAVEAAPRGYSHSARSGVPYPPMPRRLGVLVRHVRHRVALATMQGGLRSFGVSPVRRRARAHQSCSHQSDGPDRRMKHEGPWHQRAGSASDSRPDRAAAPRRSRIRSPSRIAGTQPPSPGARPSRSHRRRPDGPGPPRIEVLGPHEEVTPGTHSYPCRGTQGPRTCQGSQLSLAGPTVPPPPPLAVLGQSPTRGRSMRCPASRARRRPRSRRCRCRPPTRHPGAPSPGRRTRSSLHPPPAGVRHPPPKRLHPGLSSTSEAADSNASVPPLVRSTWVSDVSESLSAFTSSHPDDF